ncbi:hypothetical protein ACLOJK_016257 [Asimina triloba]
MLGFESWIRDARASDPILLADCASQCGGGLFLDSSAPASFVAWFTEGESSVYVRKTIACSSHFRLRCREQVFSAGRRREKGFGGGFLSVSLSIKGNDGVIRESEVFLGQNGESSGEKSSEGIAAALAEKEVEEEEKGKFQGARAGAVNTTKHLWAGAIAAMVSRTFVAPLERLKLEYIVRGEQKNLFELIQTIAASQGLKGFWKGNFVNILRTAPFKAETTNFERFLAGAAAGITATILCLPMDTPSCSSLIHPDQIIDQIRTKLVAPGGEALGGVIGAFRHMIQTEGFFSLYKGLLPSVISMAPSGAVFYGVYDILKSAYLHSPEGKKRLMDQQGRELNAFDQLELGPMRTLLYGAIAGACAEAATYPFEVVRRQLQMQVQATRLNAFATCVKIVEQGGIPALYAGLIPSLLQVLPSASISYFTYEFMKIVLKEPGSSSGTYHLS